MSGYYNFRHPNKKCIVSAIVNKINKIIKLTNTHNHEENNIEEWRETIIRSTFKRRAQNDFFIKPNISIRHKLNTMDFTVN